MAYTDYMPPVGGAKQALPELDHCRPGGQTTYPEHDYAAAGPCRRCGAAEK
ncbi:hypothetical protein [Streptomyces flaveus]|uniref:hypothetical protein n=1 Tax=Streptomyces flaveus TaxID=66370 RepID=UPI000B1D1ABB|nr:hypothetical protein [Streptomyces flaveus]